MARNLECQSKYTSKNKKNVIKEGHCVMVKVNEEDITIINIYALNNRVLKYTQCKN